MTFAIPQRLRSSSQSEDRAGWLQSLPDLATRIAREWSLTLDAAFEPGGSASWVAPARDAAGADLVLKLAWQHLESADEACGLAEWDGDGVVRLIAAAATTDTDILLLERARPGSALSALPESEQDGVIASLLLRLWRAPREPAMFRPLTSMCSAWAASMLQRSSAVPGIDDGLVSAAAARLTDLAGSATSGVLLATDLHAENVLAAEREPWLVIDPKPYVGDPAYDPIQHMLNCWGRLASDPVGLVHRMAGLTGLDPSRLGGWLWARCVQSSLDEPFLGEVAAKLPF